ncbi:hypothetical protein A2U01_0032393 [Trifolium medium]|uniref:RRM domain-containing protein n=1 Tax=Trifolium medium TaxID=97028 RepID=A0A392PGR9_9FABA|nr:hypothetical protein [Trifolium medium]
MFIAFQYYEDIIEVIIPAKRDKGGRRFGFTRFDRITDSRRFEYELDNIIIGREKISVNLSRFQHREDARKGNDSTVDRKVEGGDYRRNENNNDKENRGVSSFHKAKKSLLHCEEDNRTYAHAVRNGSKLKQDGGQQRIVVSYEGAKEDMERLKKSYVGVVVHSGMSLPFLASSRC